jgi:hypothetical protein
LLSGQNGRSYTSATASPTTHAELMSCFSNNRQRHNDNGDFASPTSARPSGGSSSAKPKIKPLNENIDYAGILLSSASPVPIPSTPSTLQNQPQRPPQAERYDDSGPFKAEMLSRMENMARGERVMPPCDRCRRLHMDCLKNLTACLGCTKKHAKCSWKEVTDQELADHPFPHPRTKTVGDLSLRRGSEDGPLPSLATGAVPAEDDPSQPVRDEELLGEDDSDDEPQPSPPLPAPSTQEKPPPLNGDDAHSPAGSSPRDDAPPSAALSDNSARAPPTKPDAAPVPAASKPDPEVSPTPSAEPPMSQEKVEQAARQILEKRIEERAGDLGGHVNGFRSVNRPVSLEPVTKAETDDVSNGVVEQPSVAV